MTLQDLVNSVWSKLHDGEVPHRFGLEEVLGAIGSAYRELKRIRPSTQYGDGCLLTEENDTLLIGIREQNPDIEIRRGLERYADALVQYACGQCIERDDADVVNTQLSDRFYTKAERLMLQ